jgi:hypothetical protein
MRGRRYTTCERTFQHAGEVFSYVIKKATLQNAVFE